MSFPRHILRWTISVETSPTSFASMDPLAQVVAVDNHPDDDGALDFWTVGPVDTPEHPGLRTFMIVGTGQEYPNDWTYLGTAPRNRAGLVWHLLEWTPF